MKLELQENFEALAKQMHGLEREARRASEKGIEILQTERDLEESQRAEEETQQFPSGNNIIPESSDHTPKPPGSIQRVSPPTSTEGQKKEVTFQLPTPSTEYATVYLHPVEDDDDDDKFFDAPEVSDVVDSTHSTPPRIISHRRTESSVSVNEATPIPVFVPPENMPAISPAKRMQV